ncbi:MAG: hypothetical protein JRI25_11495 [Deltaproteobacteria bacterium]|nr:hypothetical protein [Deltaproteobacteria bacterium]
MAKFVLIYTGGMGMDAAPEEKQKIMAEWGAWYGKMDASIVDGGAPFAASKRLEGNGIEDGSLWDTPPTGYTVIAADSLDDAAAACEDHPHLNHGGQVQVIACIDI